MLVGVVIWVCLLLVYAPERINKHFGIVNRYLFHPLLSLFAFGQLRYLWFLLMPDFPRGLLYNLY